MPDIARGLGAIAAKLPTSRGERLGPLVTTYLVVGATWTVLCLTGVLDELLGSSLSYMFVGTSVLTLAAVIGGLIVHRPRPVLPWALMLTAFLILSLSGLFLGTNPMGVYQGRNTIPDVLAIVGQSLAVLGLLTLTKSRSARMNLDALLDAGVVALFSFVVLWVYAVTPQVRDHGLSILDGVLLTMHAPIGVLLFGISLHVAYGRSKVGSTFSAFFLTLSMPTIILGHMTYFMAEVRHPFMPQRLEDVPFALAFVLFGAALLHPSIRHVVDESKPVSNPSTARFAIAAAGLVLPPIIMAFRPTNTYHTRLVGATAILLLLGAVALRVLRTVITIVQERTVLHNQANRDHLTGLANRACYESFLGAALSQSQAKGRSLAVMFLDLDRFKMVNDTLGHAGGDALIVGVARRIQESTPTNALCARLGGDEFVVILPDATPHVAEAVAERIRLSLREPFEILGKPVRTATTIGVAVWDPESTMHLEDLTRAADTALYHAKEQGRDRVAMYDVGLEAKAERRLALHAALQDALEDEELHLVFQPLVRSGDRSLHGVEALLRWSSKNLGDIPPTEFIPVAEEAGLIVPIGRWVLKEALLQVARWRILHPGLQVSVNVSARQVIEEGFVADVAAALHDANLPGQALDLELTESLLADRSGRATEVLRAVRALGVSVSVDDFGTGYSSLAYLKRFPVDRVKIDRAFVDGVDNLDGSDRTMVAAIVAMADALQMETVAEGVETQEQADYVTSLGCTLSQGYLHARPMSVSALTEQLEASARGVGIVPQRAQYPV